MRRRGSSSAVTGSVTLVPSRGDAAPPAEVTGRRKSPRRPCSDTGSNVMRSISDRMLGAGRRLTPIVLVVASGAAAYLANRGLSRPPSFAAAPVPVETADPERLQRFGRDGVAVPPGVARNMGIRTAVA